jgi:hypothetical protein
VEINILWSDFHRHIHLYHSVHEFRCHGIVLDMLVARVQVLFVHMFDICKVDSPI